MVADRAVWSGFAGWESRRQRIEINFPLSG
jgi:hypothetical protein